MQGVEVKPVDHWIRHWADLTPAAPAIIDERGDALDYRALHELTLRARSDLRALGVRRTDRVALLFGPGPVGVAAFMAVASSATAVPLNAAYKRGLLEYLLRALRPAILLLDASVESEAPAVARQLGIPTIAVAAVGCAGWFEIPGGSESPARAGGHADDFASGSDVALLMHTSGSTGRPKTVPLTHANLSASATGMARSLQLTPADRCLDMLAPSHVHGLVSVAMGALVSGSSILAMPGFRPSDVAGWTLRLAPTWITAPPAMHQELCAILADGRPLPLRTSLRFVRSGSVPLWPELIDALTHTFAVPVVEAYGMTECPHITGTPPAACRPGSVGLPYVDELQVVDETGRSLPAGELGEVVVRGRNVTPGYLDAPEATAHAFRGGWFHTGDLGSLDADGYLFLSGRRSDVINRGGMMIMPREVEEVLLRIPAVRRAVAFAVPHATLGSDLVAAVEGPVEEGSARRFLAEHLAPFKVPSRVISAARIPTEVAGKVDRSRLAEHFAAELAVAFEPPAGEVESTVARIFESVLRAGRVGRSESFFASGGDSLSAMRALSRINDELGVDLSIKAFFDAPSVREVAREIGRTRAGAEGSLVGSEVPPASDLARVPAAASIRRRDSLGPRPMSFGQQRLWFLEQVGAGSAEYNLPFRWTIEGPLNVEALRKALQGVVERHEILRTNYVLEGVEPRQVVREVARFDLPVVDLADTTLPPGTRTIGGRGGRENDVEERAAAEAARPFDLKRDPMLRASLLRIDPERHVLLLTLHHIAGDGWSQNVLWEELGALYRDGGISAELPLQYADFAEWQRDRLSGDRLETLVAYWRERLAGLTDADIPSDRPRPATPTHAGARYEFLIPEELVDQLQSLSRAEGVTLHMTLLAAFQAVLGEWSGSDDVAVGTPVAGRTPVVLERLIGFFVNTLVIRTDLSGIPTFRELLHRVRETSLAAYDHQELPFDLLVRELKPKRRPGRSPFVQAVFQLVSFDRSLALEGLEVKEDRTADVRTRFDLEMYVWQDTQHAAVVYSTELFDAGTIERLTADWLELLAAIARDPDGRLAAKRRASVLR